MAQRQKETGLYNGRVASFITAERATKFFGTKDAQPNRLLNFGTTSMSKIAMELANGTHETLGQVGQAKTLSRERLDMQREDGTGNIMAVPGPLENKGWKFLETWKSCHP